MTRITHNPRCAIFRDPPGLRSDSDCDCGAIPPLPKKPLVAVAEDPVREAARKLSYAVGCGRVASDLNTAWVKVHEAEVVLRYALAQPAPPSLTEDERKALLWATSNWPGRWPGRETPLALKAAREKLS